MAPIIHLVKLSQTREWDGQLLEQLVEQAHFGQPDVARNCANACSVSVWYLLCTMDITDYWAKFFGLNCETFDRPGLHIVPHAFLNDYWGLWIFCRKEVVIVSSPKSFLPTCKELILEVDLEDLSKADFVWKQLEKYSEKIIGPAYHGSLNEEDFELIDTSSGREISFEQANTLNDGSDPTGWDWSGCGKHQDYFFGVFKSSALVAASNYSIRDDVLSFPGVFTHPSFRGHGLAKIALSLAFRHSLDSGLLIDYQTLCENVGAIRAAESLGVKEFARHFAVRLKKNTCARNM